MVVLFFSPKNRLLKKEQFINPMATVYDGVYHPPPGRFHGRYLHSSDRVGAKKVGIGSISPRAFRRRVVRYWHPVGCRAIKLGKWPPRGRDIHRRTPSERRGIYTSITCWARAPYTALSSSTFLTHTPESQQPSSLALPWWLRLADAVRSRRQWSTFFCLSPL